MTPNAKAIVDYVQRKYGVIIGELTAEKVETELANQETGVRELDVVGRHEKAGVPRTCTLSSTEICELLGKAIPRS